MGFDTFPQPNHEEEVHIHLEQGKKVADIFNRLKGGESIESIEIPTDTETKEEYIRKLEILKNGKLIPFSAEEADTVNAQVDAYIEKLRNNDEPDMKLAA